MSLGFARSRHANPARDTVTPNKSSVRRDGISPLAANLDRLGCGY
jgi:hypothetical protein